MTHPRDPRARRAVRDPLAAAVSLELGADAMRAALLEHAGPEPEPYPRDSLGRPIEDGVNGWIDPEPVYEVPTLADPGATVPAPAPVASVAPVAGEPAQAPGLEAPPVFDSEHRGGLNWRSRHDPRSLGFGVRRRLAGSVPVQDVDLPLGPVLDQGQEGECVGCGVVDAANILRALAAAGTATLTLEDAAAVYRWAQRHDEIPGEDYTGTSVNAGMLAGRALGYWRSYSWCFGTADIAQTVMRRRPVIVGVPWLSGMYDTGPGGLVSLEGDDIGIGHCLVIAAVRLRGPQGQPGPYFGWLNSWGTSYGAGGIGWIHHRDLAALLHGTGEAATPDPS